MSMLIYLTVAAVEGAWAEHERESAQRGGAPVGNPHLGLRAGRCLADDLVHDLARVAPTEGCS